MIVLIPCVLFLGALFLIALMATHAELEHSKRERIAEQNRIDEQDWVNHPWSINPRIFAQATPPVGSPQIVWYNTADSNRLYQWINSEWVRSEWIRPADHSGIIGEPLTFTGAAQINRIFKPV